MDQYDDAMKDLERELDYGIINNQITIMKIFISIFCSILILSCGDKNLKKLTEKFLDKVGSD